MTGSLHKPLEVLKQLEVENAAKFSAYLMTNDFGYIIGC